MQARDIRSEVTQLPVFHAEGISYVHIRRENLIFLAVAARQPRGLFGRHRPREKLASWAVSFPTVL